MSEQLSRVKQLEQKRASWKRQIDYLEEQNRLLRNELFGRKSEKPVREDRDQLSLFAPSDAPAPSEPNAEEEQIAVSPHSRKKRGRKPLPEHLPRVDVIHDLDDEDKMCACGYPMSRIGQDECEKADYIPATFQVLRHIRYKYACKHCEGVESDGPTVKIAPLPAQLIPKSNATPGLSAHIFTSKS